MPLVPGKLWNARARWAGNLLPAAVYFPFLVGGAVLMWTRSEFIGPGLWLVISGIAIAWIALNFLGLPGNGFRRREIRRNLNAESPLSDEATFVAYASHGYRDVLDSVEDLGYLDFEQSLLCYRGESLAWEIPRSDVVRCRFAPNVHSILGLGRWIEISARVGKAVRTYRLEPRERDTLLGNRAFSAVLMKRIQAWMKDK